MRTRGSDTPLDEEGSLLTIWITPYISAFNSFVVQPLPDLAESMIWAMDKIERGCQQHLRVFGDTWAR